MKFLFDSRLHLRVRASFFEDSKILVAISRSLRRARVREKLNIVVEQMVGSVEARQRLSGDIRYWNVYRQTITSRVLLSRSV